MSILNKLTVHSLKMNKKRTLVTIIGIILSTALICAVGGMVTSFQQSFINSSIKNEGNYHVRFDDVPLDEQKYIENNPSVKSYFKTKQLGYAILPGSIKEAKSYFSVWAYEDKALDNNGINLIKGRLPKSSSEVIISSHMLDDIGVKYNIGDTIKINVGKRISDDGSELKSKNGYHDIDENGNVINESLVTNSTYEFKVVGIMRRVSRTVEPYNDPGYTIITRLYNNNDSTSMSVLFNKPSDYEKATKQINGAKNLDDLGKYDTTINYELLRYQGTGFSDNMMLMLITVAGVVIMIIVVTSVFVIKNSFSISITERLRQYGMLASVGATGKQIKKNVMFEGLILGCISIPIGICLGCLAVFILIWLMNIILFDFLNNMKFVFSVPVLPIIITVVMATITILLSTLFPAIKASRTSPIESIRGNNDIKIKRKKLRSPKIIRKLFGVGGDISYKNLKRSKKKYRTTVISLVVSVATFVALSVFIQYGFRLSGSYYENVGYNVSLYDSSDLALENLSYISKMEGIKKSSLHREVDMNISNDYFSKQMEGENAIPIISVGKDAFNKFVKEVGGKVSDYDDGGILIDKYYYYNDEKRVEEQAYKLKEGESFNGVINGTPHNVKVIKKTDKKPMGLESLYSDSGFLIVSDEYFSRFKDYYVDGLYIDAKDPDNFVKKIDELKETNSDYGNVDYNNLNEAVRANNAMVLIISIFLYGFIAVISLIGITNIFNTITTNMNLRSKEFAMLKSVGMTKKEFNKMIRLESIFYGAKSLIIGIPIGLGLSFLIYKAFNNGMDMGYTFPIIPIIISILFVFMIVGLTMYYSLKKINKQNIIETIRNDNI